MAQSMDPAPNADAPSFLVRDALASGCSRGILRSRRLARPFHGVRSSAPVGSCLRDRAIALVPKLRRDERLSHAAALSLAECPIRVPRQADVDVEAPQHLAQARGRGVRGHRRRREEEAFLCAVPELDDPVPMVAPLRAVQQAAGSLPFIELVVALDHLLREDDRRFDPLTRVSPEALAAFAATTTGPGARRFREAAALARVGAESRMETLMRLAGIRAGMPELRLQVDLHDACGRWIGRFDAVDDETRSIFEYDGEQHATSRRQRRRDRRKLQAARDAGWRVLVFYSEDVLDHPVEAGRSMLRFSGRAACAVRPVLARLLEERSGGDTEPAVPIPRVSADGSESQ